jgi:hypothetical protein
MVEVKAGRTQARPQYPCLSGLIDILFAEWPVVLAPGDLAAG